MRFQKRLYITMSKILPKNYKKGVKNLLKYADVETSTEEWTGRYIFFGIILSIVLYLFLPFFVSMPHYLILIMISIVFILLQFIPRFILDMTVIKRAKFVEEILPDVLLLISSNMRSGMTPDRAIMLSAREEFGPLEKQIREVAKIAMSGVGLDVALRTIYENIKSKRLERTIKH